MTSLTLDPNDDSYAVAILLQNTLDALVSVFDQAGIDLPLRRYIHTGVVSMDCEQATVQLIQVFLGPPGVPLGAAVKCEMIRSASMRIQVIRKAPALGVRGAIPDPVDLSNAAVGYTRDLWLLMAVPGLVDETNGGVLADADPIDPQGGYAGVALNLTVVVP